MQHFFSGISMYCPHRKTTLVQYSMFIYMILYVYLLVWAPLVEATTINTESMEGLLTAKAWDFRAYFVLDDWYHVTFLSRHWLVLPRCQRSNRGLGVASQGFDESADVDLMFGDPNNLIQLQTINTYGDQQSTPVLYEFQSQPFCAGAFATAAANWRALPMWWSCWKLAVSWKSVDNGSSTITKTYKSNWTCFLGVLESSQWSILLFCKSLGVRWADAPNPAWLPQKSSVVGWVAVAFHPLVHFCQILCVFFPVKTWILPLRVAVSNWSIVEFWILFENHVFYLGLLSQQPGGCCS